MITSASSPRNALQTSVAIAGVLALTTGCAGLELTPTNTHLSGEVTRCFDSGAPDLGVCRQAFVASARSGSRRGAGQALLGLAASLPSPQKESLASVALWLEPKPWLPRSSPWTKGELEALRVVNADDSEGAMLVFGSTPAGLEGPHVNLGISLPARTTLEDGVAPEAWDMPSLMARVAHVAGADGAIYTPGEGAPVVVPAGHHFVTLAKVTPTLDVSRVASARMIAQAEDAVLEGKLSRGVSLLGAALDGLEDARSTCLTSAPVHVVLSSLAPLTHDDDVTDYAEAIREGCVDREGDEPEVAAFYRALLDLALDPEEDRPAATRQEREEELTQRVSATTGAQRALVMALFDYVELTASSTRELCDDAQWQAQDDAAKATFERMRQVGRPDLVVSQRARRVFSREGAIDPEELRLWLDESEDPSHRWLRDAMLEAILSNAPSNLTPMQRIGLDTVCRRHHRALRAAISEDTYEGAAGRNGERIFEYLRHTQLCPASGGPGRLLTDAVDVALATKGSGRMPLVNLLGSLTIKGALAALEGRSQDLLAVLSAIEPKLRDVSRGLGDTPDDRVVRALLEVITPASRMEVVAMRGALERAIATLSDVITTTPQTELERHAPTMRVFLQVVESAVVGLTDPASLPAQFKSTHQTMESDLAVALTDMGWDDAAAIPLAHHVRAAQAMVTFLLSPSASGLSSTREILNELEAQTGKEWWGVAFGGLQTAGWALHAHHAELLGDAATRDGSLGRSRARLVMLIDDALAEFDVQKTNWELLRLLIPAHELVTMTILDPDSSDTLMEQALKTVVPNLEAAAKEILAQTADTTPTSSPNIIDLLPGLLDMGTSIGFANIWDPANQDIPQAAREEIARHLESIPDDLTPEMQVYLASVAGVLRTPYDKTRAMKSFARAARVARTSTEAPFTYIPLLLALRAQRSEFSGPKETLAMIDEALAKLEPNAQCGQRDGLDAMLPARAHLKASMGDLSGADASLARYLARVREGFSGDARLECSIDASRGHVSTHIELSFPLGNFLSDTPDADHESDEDEDEDDTSDNTFQVGFGFPSVPDDYERFSCTLESGSPQLAKVARVRTTRALHQLRASDDLGAQRSMDGVLEMALRFTNPQAMGTEGALWAFESGKVDTTLFPWVATLARARGFSFAALRLDNARAQLAGPRLTTADSPLPHSLEGFPDLQALSPVVEALYPLGTYSPDFEALKAALAQRAVQDALPEWSRDLLWASANASSGNPDEARGTLARMPAPPSAASVAMRDALALQVRDPQSITPDETSGVFDDLMSEEMYGESIALLLRFRGTPALQGAPMVKLYARALDEIPPQDIPALRFELTSAVLGSMSSEMDQAHLEAALIDWVDSAPGRVGLEEQANGQLSLVMTFIERKEHAKAQERIEALTSLLSTQLPLNHPLLVDMLVIEASVAIVLGQSPPLEALHRIGGSVQGISPSTKSGLDALMAARSDSDELTRAAIRFLAELQ